MGILTKKEILERISGTRVARGEPKLIENAKKDCIKSSTYNFRLGAEYIKEGSFDKLDPNKNPYLEIPKHDVVVVSTHENVNMPLDIVGRFGIRLRFTMMGLILNNAPQIDPGYKGKLFCILYNLSDAPVIIKYLEQFATIEFETTESDAPPYKGSFQNAQSVLDVVKHKLPKSGLKGLSDEFERLKKDVTQRLDRFYLTFFTIIAIVIALFGIVVVRVLLLV